MKTLIILSITVLCIFFGPCRSIFQTKENQVSGYQNVTIEEFNKCIEKENPIIIDVRTPSEITNGKIPNALEMDVTSLAFVSTLDNLPKERTYLIYCRSGKRSAKACSIMSSQGFDQLLNLKGGFNAWSKIN